ncbi:MAG: TrsE protein [Candidatus Frackibacter sp. T328-2]|nr:MAG: TrsE protein [Candidatus Frackibacter sp. T328-2]
MIDKVPLLNKIIDKRKVKGDEGRPFRKIINDYVLEISKNTYITVFEVKSGIDISNIYRYFAKYKDFKGLDYQLYSTKEKTLLIVKNKAKKVKEYENKINLVLELSEINLKRITVDEYKEILCNILNIKDKKLSEVNKKTKSSKYCRYKINHINKNNSLYRILKIYQLPNEIDLEKIQKLTGVAISIKFVYLNEGEKENVYKSIIDNLKSQKDKNDYGYKKIYPYRFKERFKLAKKNQKNNTDIIGIEIKFLIKADSEVGLDNKTKDIKEIAEFSKQRYIVKTMTHEHKKELFCSVLPINYKSDYTPAFYEKNKIRFFQNINVGNTIIKKKIFGEKLKNILENIKKPIDATFETIDLDLDEIKKPKKIIPIKKLYENGVIKLENNSYSQIVKFKNINYILEREEDKKNILEIYQSFINTIDDEINIQLYIKNRDINKKKLENDLYLKSKTGFEKYIKEYNLNLKQKLEEVAEQTSETGYYFVINVRANSIGEASKKIKQTFENSIVSNFTRFNSKVKRLSAVETEKLIYDSINNPSKTDRFLKSLDCQKNISDRLLASSYSIKKDHIQQGRNFEQVIYVQKYANKLSDTFLNDIIKLPFTFESSIHISNLKANKAITKVQNKIVSMESDKLQKQERSDNDYIPFDLKKQLDEGYYILDKLQYKDQKLFTLSFYITITASSEDEMKVNREIIKTIFSKHMCNFEILKFRQKEGLISSLPFGIDKLKEDKAFLTENVKYLHPFNSQNVYHSDGIFYGLSNSNQILSVNRKKYQNPSAFFLGVPGSGKSFTAKMEMISVFFKTDDDIIIIDPEREYGALVEALGGEVIKLSTSTDNYINPMKLNSEGYTEQNISTKIEFLITFLEKLTGEKLRASSKSIVDRVLRKIYEKFKLKDEEPVLKDFYNELLLQDEEVSKSIALDLEIYIKGSLDIFAQKSNVSSNNRIVCYDIKDLKDQLKTPALTAILDSIWDTFSKNRAIGKYTWLYIDEIYLLFKNESSSEWLFETWKRIRKYLGVITGITQNISDLLQSHTSSTMLSNSEFKLILNQAAEDRQILVEFLGISESQKSSITNAQSGTGLLIAEENVVPFSNRVNPSEIPELFDLINTSYGG